MKYQVSNIQLDTDKHSVTHNGKIVSLTNLEFALLEFLFRHADTICKREDILNQVWGQHRENTYS